MCLGYDVCTKTMEVLRTLEQLYAQFYPGRVFRLFPEMTPGQLEVCKRVYRPKYRNFHVRFRPAGERILWQYDTIDFSFSMRNMHTVQIREINRSAWSTLVLPAHYSATIDVAPWISGFQTYECLQLIARFRPEAKALYAFIRHPSFDPLCLFAILDFLNVPPSCVRRSHFRLDQPLSSKRKLSCVLCDNTETEFHWLDTESVLCTQCYCGGGQGQY